MRDDDEISKIVRDFVRWEEARNENARPTVPVPGPPRLPREAIEELAREVRIELARDDIEDTGVHRIEIIRRAVEMSQRPSGKPDSHHSEFTWWKRKQLDVLLAIIGALVLAVAALTMKLIESKTEETRERARTHEEKP